MLKVSAARAFRDNYVWLIHAPSDPRRVVAVDPGQAAPVASFLEEAGLDLAGIFATHHHFDHVGGIEDLVGSGNMPVFGPAGETVPGRTAAMVEADLAQLSDLGLSFKVLDIPGHTAGHIAFVGHGAVFCGDTLFSAGCGRLFEGTPEQMVRSLAKLSALPDDTAVYCGHEYTLDNLRFAIAADPNNSAISEYQSRCQKKIADSGSSLPSRIGIEKSVNPFLRCSEPAIRASASAQAGRDLYDEVEVFAQLRAWKDKF